MLLEQGRNVTEAAQGALMPIIKAFPSFVGAVVVADYKGNFGKLLDIYFFFVGHNMC